MLIFNIFMLIFVFIGLCLLGIPIAFSILASSIVGFLISGSGIPLVVTVQRMTRGLSTFILLAIPLYIFAGNLMSRLKIAEKIFEFVLDLMQGIKGTTAYVNVVASTIFAGMSGSAQADAAGLGIVEMKAMHDEGFETNFSAAITAASSTIGPVIPPSVTMVMYAFAAGNVSVGRIFLAGFIPGIMMALAFLITIYLLIKLKYINSDNLRIRSRISFKKTILDLMKIFPCIVAPIFLALGLIIGFATPTELGAIIVVYIIFLGVIYREITFNRLYLAIFDTIITIGALLLIISCAFSFGLNIIHLQLPSLIENLLLVICTSKEIFLLVVVAIFIILGTFMETTVILIIFTPIFVPIAAGMGIDLIHFGMVEVLSILIGALTPPFGICLYIVSYIGNISIWEVSKSLIPFYIVLGICLVLIMYFPVISLYLPNLLLNY